MNIPSNINFSCPVCEEETMNHVLKGKASSRKNPHMDLVLECLQCEHVHHVKIEMEKTIELPVVLSQGGGSTKTKVSLPQDEPVSVGEELVVDEKRVKVTALEKDGRRVKTATAEEISTLWVKYYEKLAVKISIVDKAQTYSRKTLAAPEEEFEVGEILELPGSSCVIYLIKTRKGRLKQGYAKAEDILRIYTKPMRKPRRRYRW